MQTQTSYMRNIVLIAAMDDNNGIGYRGGFPWDKLKGDLPRFQRLTDGFPMIMGRKTLESLPGLLPGRPHIVLTGQEDFHYDGTSVVHSLDDALKEASKHHTTAYVIGGGNVYEQFLPQANIQHITHVAGEFPADTRYPQFDEKEWLPIYQGKVMIDNPDNLGEKILSHEYYTYLRK